MSRVFDALQKSQAENPGASPLAQGQPEPPPAEAPVITPADAAAAGLPLGVNAGVPAARTDVPSVIPAGIRGATAADGKWLNVPDNRVLHPRPTPEQRLVAIAEPDSPGAEMFRVLSTRLAHMQHKRRLQKLLITSSEGDEGKSVVAVNLAFCLAHRPNERVLLIEADLRRPTASSLLATSPLVGITEWSEGKLILDDALYRVGDLPLWFLSGGHGIEEPMSLLESNRFAEMLETISSSFDWVLLDATPMLPMADSTSLSRLCDGVLVVVREGYTRRRVLNKALASIEQNKLLGTILNEASMLEIGSYYRYYGSKGGKSKKEAQTEGNKVDAVPA
jgi:capsular exopolysaccharide synthesis family protein